MLLSNLVDMLKNVIVHAKGKVIAIMRKDSFDFVSEKMLALWYIVEKPSGILDVRHFSVQPDPDEVILDLVFGTYDGAYAYVNTPADEFDRLYKIIEL